ncbi:MAG: DUF1700 domain-containing protein [Clostridiales bacterium]|nr:DUF1700 domain-containing protein [Clostridiales bacterium]
MNTQDYINELKLHLRKLPEEEREDAISYYFEYLVEAGPDGAAEVMDKLGTPAELAAGIRADQAMQDFEDAEGPKAAAIGKGVQAVWYAGLAAVPRTILAVLVTAIIIVVFFAIIIALFATSVGLMIGGIVTFGGGIWLIPFSGGITVFGLGIGLVIFGCGFLLFLFSIWCSKGMLRGIAGAFNGIRQKREHRHSENTNHSGRQQS